MDEKKFVSRGGLKLEHALKEFGVDVTGMTVLDVGSSTGGFVDCLLQSGAAKVYALDTAYGEFAWKLRNDPRVVVIERQNILYLDTLPDKVDLVTIDVTFTSLNKILPKVREFLKPGGKIIALLKPQYERQDLALKHGGIIPQENLKEVVNSFKFRKITESPIKGGSGNTEYLILCE
ncbi:TlyA family RNA methyltransferase [Patescibacteria group bacterium]|nr:TlyA family RNA methyltransferase [Patescibacteria group bacterium]